MKKKTEMTDLLPIFLMGGIFVIVNVLAWSVLNPFKAFGIATFANPSDPANLVYFVLTLLVFTVIILLISKFWSKQLVRGIILGAAGILCVQVSYPLLASVVSPELSLGLSIAAAAVMIILLVKYPEWYVIDASGALIAIGATAMMGISLSLFLVTLLLVGLSIYDVISVYKTQHMIDLADTVVDLKLPVMFVIPRRRNYSLVKDNKSLKEKLSEGEERDAFFMGVGDVVIPGILAASVFYNLTTNGLLIALSVTLGTLIGFAALMTLVIKGKPEAGLPFLCTGAILGYLVSSYLVFGEIMGLNLLI